MEIIFKEENGKLFGSTKMIGIGKRTPNLIYGKKAKELREKANLSIEELATELGEKPKLIADIENQEKSLVERLFEKYKGKFGVEKEYFFDLDLETLLLTAEGHVLKDYKTSENCKKAYDYYCNKYFEALDKGIIVFDFTSDEL